MLEVEKAKEKVAFVAKKMAEEGLVVETWGNVSMRTRDSIVITPSGMDYKRLNFVDMIVMDFHGNMIEGKWKVSSEYPMHRCIYRNREDVTAIIHTHSTFATSFAAARKEMYPVVEDFAQIVGSKIKVAEYALPGTDELAASCINFLKENAAVLLANHGVVAVGNSLEEVLLTCRLIEKNAETSVYAAMLGGPYIIEEKNVKELRRYYLEQYGQK